ncbi:hypothetical protein A4G20_05140 [Pasteurellaceae bacterium RH1A]|nr:hypothetical protein A4G20_05140 [Pasteurellaceae bacterium RH1A]
MQLSDNSKSLNNDEILAIIRLIFFIKFEADDPELLIYAGSPTINSALEKMLLSHPFYKDRMEHFGQLNQESLDFVKSKILKDSRLNENMLKELVNNCIFPYK